ncbi:MAG: EamA family transporter [Calditrichaceae bacterium]
MFPSDAIILSVLTGISFGFQVVLIKILSRKLHQFGILQFLFLCTGVFILILSITSPWHEIDIQRFLPSLLISFIINLVAFSLLTKAIIISPVSLVMPFVGLTPLFLVFTAYLILGESVTITKFLGVFGIVIGSFILQLPREWKTKNKSLRFRFFTGEKGIVYVIIVAFLWSISASIEKIAVIASTPEIYATTIHLMLGIAFLFSYRHMRKKEREGDRREIKYDWSLAFSIALLVLVSTVLALSQLTAIKYTLVTYVISFKRAGILISSVIGFMFFHEKNYTKTITGTIIILIGAFIITSA